MPDLQVTALGGGTAPLASAGDLRVTTLSGGVTIPGGGQLQVTGLGGAVATAHGELRVVSLGGAITAATNLAYNDSMRVVHGGVWVPADLWIVSGGVWVGMPASSGTDPAGFGDGGFGNGGFGA